jgi:putative RecB family exonuclease
MTVWSPSRLSIYEECPRLFDAVYVSKTHKKVQSEGGELGDCTHEALRLAFEPRLLKARPTVPTPEEVEECLVRAATAVGLKGQERFTEIREMLFQYFSGLTELNLCLAIEHRVTFEVGEHQVLCILDRVDQSGPDTEVIDYKTRQQPFSKAEVQADLQLGLYNLAARAEWPNSDRYFTTIVPLRFGGQIRIQHTDDELADIHLYTRSLIAQIEADKVFTPRLNSNCLYCGIRGSCRAYADALQGQPRTIAEDLSDLEAVARERQQVALLYKLIDARKQELDDAMRPHLKNVPEMIFDNIRYRLLKKEKLEYHLDDVLRLAEKHAGIEPEQVAPLVGKVDNKMLASFLKELTLRTAENSADSANVRMLESALQNAADRSYTRSFDARPVPKPRKAGKKCPPSE